MFSNGNQRTTRTKTTNSCTVKLDINVSSWNFGRWADQFYPSYIVILMMISVKNNFFSFPVNLLILMFRCTLDFEPL